MSSPSFDFQFFFNSGRESLMNSILRLLSLAILLLPVVVAQTPPQREIAITFDDLPGSHTPTMTAQEVTEMTTRLVGTLKQQQIPVVGFVNEAWLYAHTGEVDARIAALNQWLDAGFELGNHTFSHPSLNKVGPREFEESIVRGETVTKILLAKHNMKMRYFRNPFLDVGRDLQTRREVEAFLINRGYKLAPITMDPRDWAFAGIYDEAKKRGDTALQQKIAAAYLAFAEAVFAHDERFSRDLLGYEPRQIILLHGNNLEADHVAELLDLLRKRGYRFITLAAALDDNAYSLPNTYVGEHGAGWLEQWAISQGKFPPPDPEFPPEMEKLRQSMPSPAAPPPPVL
jgi:peptidoglycan/xylan/chitin deacetylase (PgdA/CDA1 family)